MIGSGTTALVPALVPASEESTQMAHAEPQAEPGATISREPQAGVQIDDPRISQEYLRAVSEDGQWRIVDNSPNGMFVDGRRKSSVTVSDKTIVRFGDPTGGKALTFEVVRPSKSRQERPQERRTEQPSADGSLDDATNSPTGELDPGLVRAGSAAAARRRELDISQRSLAADGIINAGALIAFEKGRSWPRERTRAKLEEVLQWPAGTIARIREGDPAAHQPPATPTPAGHPEASTSDGPASLIAQAVAAAVDTCSLAIAALPSPQDPDFTERAAPILADLRQLEGIAVQATRISRITPELIKALGAVRRHHDKLMTLSATAPGATLAQRLYAARRRANLSTAETAQAAGVAEEMIVRAEAEEALPATATEAIEALINQIN
ncbi:FHA domain-containing protein [Mycobacterium riyadhense]